MSSLSIHRSTTMRKPITHELHPAAKAVRRNSQMIGFVGKRSSRPTQGGWDSSRRQATLDHSNVLGFLTLFPGRGIELDTLTLFKVLVPITLNIGEMYENVIALFARDEAEALFRIEKLHYTLCHGYSIHKATDQPIWSPRYLKQ